MSGTSSSDKTRHEVLKLVVPGEYFGELGTILFFLFPYSFLNCAPRINYFLNRP